MILNFVTGSPKNESATTKSRVTRKKHWKKSNAPAKRPTSQSRAPPSAPQRKPTPTTAVLPSGWAGGVPGTAKAVEIVAPTASVVPSPPPVEPLTRASPKTQVRGVVKKRSRATTAPAPPRASFSFGFSSTTTTPESSQNKKRSAEQIESESDSEDEGRGGVGGSGGSGGVGGSGGSVGGTSRGGSAGTGAGASGGAQTPAVADNKPQQTRNYKHGSRKAPDESRKISQYKFDAHAGASLPARSRHSQHLFVEDHDDFANLGLTAQLVTQLTKPRSEGGMGISRPTRVQAQMIPAAMQDRDVLARSETGSGKTLAYLIPIAHRLLSRRVSREEGSQAIVLAPTRELAAQIVDVAQALLKPFPWLVCGSVTGGEKRKSEKARLRKGVTLLIATPGRLLDHLQKTTAFETKHLQVLVLDEADRLLDLGFEKQVKDIVSEIRQREQTTAQSRRMAKRPRPSTRVGKHNTVPDVPSDTASSVEPSRYQTLLLSATINSGIRALAGAALIDPVWIRIDNGARDVAEAERKMVDGEDADAAMDDAQETLVTPVQLAQQYLVCPCKYRPAALAAFLRRELSQGGSVKVIIFMSTCDSVEFHFALFTALAWPSKPGESLIGASLYKLHGNIAQSQRMKTWRDFAAVSEGVLLCTDVAARGLDLPAVNWIVQYDPPADTKDYVHRVGRTARRGHRGNSVIVLSPGEVGYVEVLAKRGLQLTQLSLEATASGAAEATDMHLSRKRPAHESVASQVMFALSTLVTEDTELSALARTAFQAFVRAYSTYGKDVKHIFRVRSLHFGHVAKSFGLREPPTAISSKAKAIRSNEAKREEFVQLREKRKNRKKMAHAIRKRRRGNGIDEFL